MHNKSITSMRGQRIVPVPFMYTMYAGFTFDFDRLELIMFQANIDSLKAE